MFFILPLLCISIVSVHSTLRTDCYGSFSIPIIYIKISHFYPSGPLYLYATFRYKRYSNSTVNNLQIFDVNYHFRILYQPCTISTVFSTLGKDFKKLDVKIILYPYMLQSIIALIEYTFYPGFSPGIYRLGDYSQNFAVDLKVLDVLLDYLKVPVESIGQLNTYIRHITGRHQYLCVVTPYNLATVLKPIYRYNAPLNIITGILAKISVNGKYLGIRNYPAFECWKNETSTDDHIVFIIDGKNFDIDLYVIYTKFNILTNISKTKRFSQANTTIDYVYNLENLQQDYKKIFFIRYHSRSKKCPDGSRPILYLSEDRAPYFAKIYTRLNVSHGVEYAGEYERSPLDPCEEKKNKE